MKKLVVIALFACLVCLVACSGLVYTQYGPAPANPQIWWIPKDNLPQPLYPTSSVDRMPDVSHDGKTVAFTKTIGTSGRIIVRDLSDVSGATERNLTSGYRPRWSPSGAWILFTDQQKIFMIKWDGTGRQQITNPTGEWAGWADDFGHDFLNDNTIIFTRRMLTNANESILLVQDVNAATVYPLFAGSDPVVSHDSKLLAFKGHKYPKGPATFESFYIYEMSPTWRVKLKLDYVFYPGAPPPPIPNPDTYGFSYDDDLLLFSSLVSTPSKYTLFRMKVDGTDVQRIDTPSEARYPDGFKKDW